MTTPFKYVFLFYHHYALSRIIILLCYDDITERVKGDIEKMLWMRWVRNLIHSKLFKKFKDEFVKQFTSFIEDQSHTVK